MRMRLSTSQLSFGKLVTRHPHRINRADTKKSAESVLVLRRSYVIYWSLLGFKELLLLVYRVKNNIRNKSPKATRDVQLRLASFRSYLIFAFAAAYTIVLKFLRSKRHSQYHRGYVWHSLEIHLDISLSVSFLPLSYSLISFFIKFWRTLQITGVLRRNLFFLYRVGHF